MESGFHSLPLLVQSTLLTADIRMIWCWGLGDKVEILVRYIHTYVCQKETKFEIYRKKTNILENVLFMEQAHQHAHPFLTTGGLGFDSRGSSGIIILISTLESAV